METERVGRVVTERVGREIAERVGVLIVRVGLEITDRVGLVIERLTEELTERVGRETAREAVDREAVERDCTDLDADEREAAAREEVDRVARARDWAWSQAAGKTITADIATINNNFAFMTHLHSLYWRLFNFNLF